MSSLGSFQRIVYFLGKNDQTLNRPKKKKSGYILLDEILGKNGHPYGKIE